MHVSTRTTPQTVLAGSIGHRMWQCAARALGEAEAGLLMWGSLASTTRLALLRASCYFCSRLPPLPPLLCQQW